MTVLDVDSSGFLLSPLLSPSHVLGGDVRSSIGIFSFFRWVCGGDVHKSRLAELHHR